MCGIAGVRATAGEPAGDPDRDAVVAMVDTLTHRGPDACGTLASGPLVLGHTRLAIVDLSPTGAQPMGSASGRWTIAFNGEVYGHSSIRADLAAKGHSFQGTSDTEVLLEYIDLLGVQAALERVNAMYALAAWDAERSELWLARDPAGEKPLYLWVDGTRVVFASELGALCAHPDVPREIDEAARADYFAYGYIPAPATIYRGVEKLQPGEWRCYGPNGMRRGQVQPTVDTAATLEELLDDAVRLRLEADVPVGVFLSGGIDSTLVAAIAARHGEVSTFTAAFDERSHDESGEAAAIAYALGTDHTTLPITTADGLSLAPKIPEIFGEPFADPSAIPTLLIATAAREHVTVALTGDGGDELFVGYNRLVAGRRIDSFGRRVPAPLAQAAGSVMGATPPAMVDRAAGGVSRLLRRPQPRSIGDKVQKAGKQLHGSGRTPAEAADFATRIWPEPSLLTGHRAMTRATGTMFDEALLDHDRDMTLPEQMLTKVDRSTMQVALEARPPLLDPRVIAFARAQPLGAHLGSGSGKQLLRDVVYRLVDRDLLDRPKMGFDPPIGAWLRGPLREWAADRLAPSELRATGVTGTDVVTKAWDRHQSGRSNEDYRLWAILQYQAWFESVHQR